VNLPFFLANRLARTSLNSFSKFIVKICILATCISVAVMILSTAIFDGFKRTITNKFYSSWGNVHVMNFVSPGDNLYLPTDLVLDSNLLDKLKNEPNVQSAHPYYVQRALLKSKSEMEGILMKGIDKSYLSKLANGYNLQGTSIHFSDSTYSKEIMLSKYTAQKLNVQLNDSLLVYFMQKQNELPRARKLKVCGIFETGLQENDKHFAIADIQLLHRLAMDSNYAIFGYELHLKNADLTDQTNTTIYNTLLAPPLKSYTIQERFLDVFTWLNLIKKDLNLIYIIVLIVAIINMISSTLILILERTTMVGILKSLGATTKSIANIFFWQSLYISFVGILLGTLLAFVLAFVQSTFHVLKLDPAIYYINYVQVDISIVKTLVIIFGTLIISALLLIIPLILVKKINPIKALRFE
jgi:lipoprotein-releasing system permease protein